MEAVEEKRLESLLFGIQDKDLANESQNDTSVLEEPRNKFDLFELVEDVSPSEDSVKKSPEVAVDEEQSPAWVDPEDESSSISKRKFSQVNDAWVEALGTEPTSKRVRDIFRADITFIEESRISSSKFHSKDLVIVPILDANKQSKIYGKVRSIDWHSRESLFLASGGSKKKIKLFSIDGKVNKHVSSINIKSLYKPVGRFCHGRNEVIITGMNRHFYAVDVESGVKRRIPFLSGQRDSDLRNFSVSAKGPLMAFCSKQGRVLLATKNNKSFVRDLKMNGSALSCDFTSCGNYLMTTGSDCSIYEWDLRNMKCLSRVTDYASTCTNVVRVNAQNRSCLATGATSGCVNLYRRTPLQEDSVKPLKEFMHLRSQIKDIAFNKAGTLMAFCSDEAENAIRLVTMSDMAVVPSFPRLKQRVGEVTCLSFSSDNRYLCLGNTRGRCLLYRIENYFTEN